jgi:cytochrome bd ubiquinol oxidase subunit II
MDTVWFAIVVVMLTVFTVLDGFDFGVGIIHRIVARTDQERRIVLAAIAPVWDGNEVWLIAAGGVLFMAFPRTYATAFSGFYLALIIVLWLLILRGIAIELRSHQDNVLWREFWDTVLVMASGLLAIVFGAALGNLVRGVPLDNNGLAGMPLFTNFLPGTQAGILDWYTSSIGVFALLLLAGHGALFLVWRTVGAVQARSAACGRVVWRCIVPAWVLVTAATAWVQPEVLANLLARPWSMVFVGTAFAGLVGVFRCERHGDPWVAFAASSTFIASLLLTTMIGNYPYWLRSTIDPALSLTAENTAAGAYGLRAALGWCSVGLALATAYFVLVFRYMRGKVELDEESRY